MKRQTARPQKRWQPLRRAEKVMPSPEQIAAVRAQAVAAGMDPDEAELLMRAPAEMWKNDRYTVIVTRNPERLRHVTRLSIRRNDRGTDIPWRHLQRIKTELAGAEAEAVELFPAESRLVDTANQRWLWLPLPAGEKIPLGFSDGRRVSGPEDTGGYGAKQAPLEEYE